MIINILWIVSAGLLGFLISAVFAGLLKLQRNIYLIFYISLAGAFVTAFFMINNIDPLPLLMQNWYWGILGAAIAAPFVVRNVLSQPSSERSKGGALVLDIVWPGFIYGLIDSLLLTVVPVLSVYMMFQGDASTVTFWSKAGTGTLALIASIFVTALYHLGYPEFRNKNLFWTFLGNGILTLAFIITANPLAAIIPHIIMHITAIIHGRETTGQVPPHYG